MIATSTENAKSFLVKSGLEVACVTYHPCHSYRSSEEFYLVLLKSLRIKSNTSEESHPKPTRRWHQQLAFSNVSCIVHHNFRAQCSTLLSIQPLLHVDTTLPAKEVKDLKRFKTVNESQNNTSTSSLPTLQKTSKSNLNPLGRHFHIHPPWHWVCFQKILTNSDWNRYERITTHNSRCHGGSTYAYNNKASAITKIIPPNWARTPPDFMSLIVPSCLSVVSIVTAPHGPFWYDPAVGTLNK